MDRIWSLSFIAIIATNIANLIAALGDDVWWTVGVANATTSFAAWSMWSGLRAYRKHSSCIGVSGTVAVIVLLAAAVEGSGGGEWAGAVVHILAFTAGAALVGTEIVTGPLRRRHPARVLAALAYLVALYYLVRLALFLFYGPESREFNAYVGTPLTTVALTLLVVGAAFCMVSLRAADFGRGARLAVNFDPLTGARTPATFQVRAEPLLRAAEREARQVCLVVVRPESIDAIAIAFGSDYADRALAVCGEAATALAPGTLLGLDSSGQLGFEVLLPDTSGAEALAWATRLRKELLGTPLEVPESRLRLTVSLGVASATDFGYELSDLRPAAAAAACRAVESGGNRVVAADPAGGAYQAGEARR